ncbi:MAG: immunoglobulin-like domain-containing protein [archaeon]|jgi:hypothetical protein
MQNKAQGAIEYLLIIGTAILVVAIVIITMTTITSTGKTTVGTEIKDQNSAINVLQQMANEGKPLPPIDDITPPVITLNGPNPQTIEIYNGYNEYGVTVTDNDGQTYPATIDSTSVDPSSVGTYNVIYSATDSQGNTTTITRTILVRDTEPPQIYLDGSNPMTVPIYGTYPEPGAWADDYYEGSLNATSSGTVNTSVIGTYTITYNATDSSGNSATPITRIVNVIADTTPPTVSLTSPNGITYSNPINAIVHFSFTPNDNSTIRDCNLKINGLDKNTITNVTSGVNNTIDYNVQKLTNNLLYNWNISCTDRSNNTTTTTANYTFSTAIQNSYYVNMASNSWTTLNWNLGKIHTISFWTKDLPSGAVLPVFTSTTSLNTTTPSGGLDFATGGGNYIYYRLNTGTYNWEISPITGWHNFVIVRNETSLTLYKDGINKGSKTTVNEDYAPKAAFVQYYNNSGFKFFGGLDEFVIYTTAKDQAWATAQYNNGLGIYNADTTNAFAIYHNNTGSGTTLTDSSGTGKNLILFNITWPQSQIS